MLHATRYSAKTLPSSSSAWSARLRAVSSLHRVKPASISRVILLHTMYTAVLGHRQPVATLAMDAHAYTALPIAAARAVAFSQGDNPIIRDPLAAKLVAGETHLMREGANVEYMSMRCLLGDELIQERHAIAGVRQVVSLGAGMDSRAFRLNLMDTTFYEVDKQGLFDIKVRRRRFNR